MPAAPLQSAPQSALNTPTTTAGRRGRRFVRKFLDGSSSTCRHGRQGRIGARRVLSPAPEQPLSPASLVRHHSLLHTELIPAQTTMARRRNLFPLAKRFLREPPVSRRYLTTTRAIGCRLKRRPRVPPAGPAPLLARATTPPLHRPVSSHPPATPGAAGASRSRCPSRPAVLDV